jgi:hypothetical protein
MVVYGHFSNAICTITKEERGTIGDVKSHMVALTGDKLWVSNE